MTFNWSSDTSKTIHYEAREENMMKYLQKIKDLISKFESFEIQQISKLENSHADLFSKLATLAPSELSRRTFFEILSKPCTEELAAVM